jgi:alpha-maltose-1-phosphate synthase
VADLDSVARLRVDLLTREYPPAVYGGAGVHAEYLARELRHRCDLRVHAFGDPNPAPPGVDWHPELVELAGTNQALRTIGVDLTVAAACEGADVVHSHTWYANLAGHLAKLLYGIPHVVTTHSLEPLRPWKAEQLGGGYRLSSWCERTAIEAADAVIAVSNGMASDVQQAYPAVDPSRIHVVHNGIDTQQYAPDERTDVLERLHIDPTRPSVVYVGRVTRQKGLPYLLRAAREMPDGTQLVLLAGAPDTPEIGAEVEGLVAELRVSRGDDIIWVPEMLPKNEVIQILSHASMFVCPSIYEPMGIVNLEAMACEAPVVATATGGIPEVVADGQTGILVPIGAQHPDSEPVDPDAFVAAFAHGINTLLADPARAGEMGRAGRRRAVEHFSWSMIAERTMDVYRSVL